ncbi:transmembrane protein, putative (macronuclear) [Tetrahymena thermophila SB210]|uniref:Transmembrane protein, putative n=1 Tax=Tetrahymena thermophila (strain SB210) TaxID=312017 RepID=W7X4T0_TETTS|nr:transmembrane protein, putative [Tetrahymena thermophila SB210]EWS71373.1 transmembrane protein, putative [Tetrahymena thermophila SB210]|eukprot:XP_012656091.1 transmembrane protein, putative [Tetrahymena thermophila SB210]
MKSEMHFYLFVRCLLQIKQIITQIIIFMFSILQLQLLILIFKHKKIKYQIFIFKYFLLTMQIDIQIIQLSKKLYLICFQFNQNIGLKFDFF